MSPELPLAARLLLPELPAGWVWTRVNELGVIGAQTVMTGPFGTGLGRDDFVPDGPGKVPVITIGCLHAASLVRHRAMFVTDAKAAVLERYRLSQGDILFSRMATVGRAGFVDRAWEGALFNYHIMRVRLAPTVISPQFFIYFVRGSSVVSDYVRLVNHGMTRDGINTKQLLAMPVPLAPLAHQSRVVEALDSYLSRLDEAEAALERVQRNLRRYRAAVLQAAVEGRLVPTEAELARAEERTYEPASELLERILAERQRRWEETELARLKAAGKAPRDDKWKEKSEEPPPIDAGVLPTLPEGWCWASVDQLGEVSGGLTKNAKRQGLGQHLPYLRVANVYADELRLEDVQTIGVADSEIRRTLLHRGDLLVVEGNGSLDQIGRVAVWDSSIHPCLHQNHIIKVRFSPPTISAWALRWLLSPPGRSEIQRVASSTSGLHTLSLSKVGTLPVPVPPLVEQLRIEAEIDRCLSVIRVLAKAAETADQRLQRLRQAILKWAFEGKLVDQDPTDEPASVLLERIRAERAARAGGDGAVRVAQKR